MPENKHRCNRICDVFPLTTRKKILAKTCLEETDILARQKPFQLHGRKGQQRSTCRRSTLRSPEGSLPVNLSRQATALAATASSSAASKRMAMAAASPAAAQRFTRGNRAATRAQERSWYTHLDGETVVRKMDKEEEVLL